MMWQSATREGGSLFLARLVLPESRDPSPARGEEGGGGVEGEEEKEGFTSRAVCWLH